MIGTIRLMMTTSMQKSFMKSKSESTLYTKTVKGSGIIIIVVYVDDLVFIKNGTKVKN